MLQITNVLLTLIFLVISVFHFYWAFGGNSAKEGTIPKKVDGKSLFQPGFMACIAVAIGFLFFIWILYMPQIQAIPKQITSIFQWLLLLIFLVRVIGDFNYIGLFKKIKNSTFAKNDSMYFVPLCALIFLLILIKITLEKSFLFNL